MRRQTQSPRPTPTVRDEEVRAILDRYHCPIPFHAVRTRFLGSIASPALSVAPIETVKALWGGELPAFDSIDAVNELLATLVMGLWNQLARHQERRMPFRLVPVTIENTPAGIAQAALVRREELDGFVDGLFGSTDSLELPKRAHRALGILADIRSFFGAMMGLASDPHPGPDGELAKTAANIRKLTRIAEHEMHEAVLACTRARRQMLEGVPTIKPTIH